jgi:hypothetical protein
MSTKEAAMAYLSAHNAHDARAVGDLYAPGGRHREMATGAERVGGDSIAEGLASFLKAFPDAAWDFEEPVIDSGRVSVAYSLTATLRGRLGPFEPVSNTWIMLMKKRTNLQMHRLVQSAPPARAASSGGGDGYGLWFQLQGRRGAGAEPR